MRGSLAPWRATLMLVASSSLLVGCALDTAIIQPGGNGRQGVLLNYSCGAAPCDPVDPSKPTIVLTHGWNPLPNRIHTTFASSSAREIRRRYGDSFNLLSWDWNAVRIPLRRDAPYETGLEQGRMMASALQARGVAPQQTHLIAHSAGTVAAAEAARILAHCQGPLLQVTLLEPPENIHDKLFCKLRVTSHAQIVENYWAPGISGYGAPANYPGVRNYRVEGPHPIRGIVDLSVSNHVQVMQWYYDTIRCPDRKYGFQESAVVAGSFGMRR